MWGLKLPITIYIVIVWLYGSFIMSMQVSGNIVVWKSLLGRTAESHGSASEKHTWQYPFWGIGLTFYLFVRTLNSLSLICVFVCSNTSWYDMMIHCIYDTIRYDTIRYDMIWCRGVVGSTLAVGSIGHGFESEHRLFSHYSASAFSKLRSLAKCSLDDSVHRLL